MHPTKRLSGTVLSLVMLAGTFMACGKYEDMDVALSASKITMTQAVKAARAEVEGGVATEVKLEMIEEKPVFSVEIASAEKVTSVRVDGISGEVLGKEEVTPDPEERRIIDELLAIDAEQQIGLIGALKKAVAGTDKGQPVEVDLEEMDGELLYDIRVVVGNLVEKKAIKIKQD
ncbi:MAG: PepSY domain-containing protein [Planctomycetota bacterium]